MPGGARRGHGRQPGRRSFLVGPRPQLHRDHAHNHAFHSRWPARQGPEPQQSDHVGGDPERYAEAQPQDQLEGDSASIGDGVPRVTPRFETQLAVLRECAALVGEDIRPAELRILMAMARGDTGPYRAEVNRLASKFLEQASASW